MVISAELQPLEPTFYDKKKKQLNLYTNVDNNQR